MRNLCCGEAEYLARAGKCIELVNIRGVQFQAARPEKVFSFYEELLNETEVFISQPHLEKRSLPDNQIEKSKFRRLSVDWLAVNRHHCRVRDCALWVSCKLPLDIDSVLQMVFASVSSSC